jgi:hypothetical protein
MNRGLKTAALIALFFIAGGSEAVKSACCYFSAKGKDVLQPAQKAFITWEPESKTETFTVQPKFEGNAADFGMVIPTPTQPKLDEMPRDFFKELAVFTILEPMDLSKYKQNRQIMTMAAAGGERRKESSVVVLESGVVGSLDYKIIKAGRADDLYAWLKENNYSYAGDESTLGFYIKKGWFFTVMKIDPMQMKKRGDGTYEGDVTPTRFTFISDELIYPLKITQISVKETTEALFYVQAPQKMDLPGDFSYQYTWSPMWSQATNFAIPEKLTQKEKEWQKHLQPLMETFNRKSAQLWQTRHQPASLEWAKKITMNDIAVLKGARPYNRQAPREDVNNLKLLLGHVQNGQFITKIRKIFSKDEMNDDLRFVLARIGDREDDIEYFSILPTSPP